MNRQEFQNLKLADKQSKIVSKSHVEDDPTLSAYDVDSKSNGVESQIQLVNPVSLEPNILISEDNYNNNTNNLDIQKASSPVDVNISEKDYVNISNTLVDIDSAPLLKCVSGSDGIISLKSNKLDDQNQIIDSGEPTDVTDQTYILKTIKYQDSTLKIITQNRNGPCPLLALCIKNIILRQCSDPQG